jgi:hypothetical protein
MDEVIELERLEKAYQREYCCRLESRINYYKKGLKRIMVDAMPKTRKQNHIVSKDFESKSHQHSKCEAIVDLTDICNDYQDKDYEFSSAAKNDESDEKLWMW